MVEVEASIYRLIFGPQDVRMIDSCRELWQESSHSFNACFIAPIRVLQRPHVVRKPCSRHELLGYRPIDFYLQNVAV